MTLGNMFSQMGVGTLGTKLLTERYADYAQPSHDQHVLYGYEHSQPSPGHAAYSKHNNGGGHKSNAAMSALTLLAFLFFLHILQQCLKDHMNAMQQPQIMVMTGGREGDVTIAKRADIKKIDKSGNTVTKEHESQTDRKNKVNEKISDDETFEGTYLTKITMAEKSPKIDSQKYKHSFKNYSNRSSGFVSALNDYHKY